MKKHSCFKRHIIPLGEFKTGHPLIIAQNGRPVRVFLSPEEYNKLAYRKQFMESVEQGLMVVEDGEVYGPGEVRAKLAEKRATRKP